MKPLTHIVLTHLNQVEEAYRDFDDQFEAGLDEANKQFQEGKTILQCSQAGIIFLNELPKEHSKKVDNPYSTPKPAEEASIKEKPLQQELKSARRLRIEAMLRTLDHWVSDKELTLLIAVFDLEQEKEDFATLAEINQLKN